MMTATEKIAIGIKLNALFNLHRQLRLEINMFWASKREFDQLRDDFRHIKNNRQGSIDPADLHKDYFG